MRTKSAAELARPLGIHELPLVRGTAKSLEGYGRIVDDAQSELIEIVRWPAQGWRPVDPDTGDQGGVAEGTFSFWWQGEVLYGANEAVNDSYQLGWSREPSQASETAANPVRSRVLFWHANYHPDGGQLFFPKARAPFVVPLAPPGDDLRPESFAAFWFDGSKGLYIHPNVWHEAVFPMAERAAFDDRQGRVHARVSVDFVKEFGVFLAAPLREP